MYVCLCNEVTDRQIREAARGGIQDLSALGRCLGVATQCGRCREFAEEVLQEAVEAARSDCCLAA